MRFMNICALRQCQHTIMSPVMPRIFGNREKLPCLGSSGAMTASGAVLDWVFALVLLVWPFVSAPELESARASPVVDVDV